MSEEKLDIRLKRIKEFVKHKAESSTPFRVKTLFGDEPQVIPSYLFEEEPSDS